MLSEYDKKHLGSILGGEGTYFTAHLLRLIAKADSKNRELLGKVYPEEVTLVTEKPTKSLARGSSTQEVDRTKSVLPKGQGMAS